MNYMAAVIIAGMLALSAQGPYSLKLVIKDLPAWPATDIIYLAGSSNQWNPADEQYRLQKDAEGHFFIEIKKLAPGPLEYKFTRGSWAGAESDITGNDVPNRVVNIQSDTVLTLSVAGWKDGFGQKKQASTASAQVSIIDTAFYMPGLNRTRRIWVYLPQHYLQLPGKKYPVLYMHDGQNLFDNATSYAGEWGVDEALDSIKNACIVVGIDNGGSHRMTEYNPNDTKQFGKGEGKQYLAFIVEHLKPFIDHHYRTLPGSQDTWMAGSSMGGLISFYAGLYYPTVFGRLGIFSPSFWVVPQMKAQVKQLVKKATHGKQKYYFYAGGAEGSGMARGMETIATELSEAGGPQVKTVINPQGRHNETNWSAAFPAFYRFISFQ